MSIMPVGGQMGLELAYSDDVARATEGLYAKVSGVIPKVEWPAYAPLRSTG
jgi:hypothetical protein